MVGSMKWILCGTEYRLQKIVQHYLQIGTGDFTSVIVNMRSILHG